MTIFCANLPNGNKPDGKLIMIINMLQHPLGCLTTIIFCEFIMPMDINKYRKYVDDFDLTEKQKVELIQTVRSIMESFVDKAFGIHPVQQCQKDLQSPVNAVKSGKSQNYLEKKSAPQLEYEIDSRKVRKETKPYVRPK